MNLAKGNSISTQNPNRNQDPNKDKQKFNNAGPSKKYQGKQFLWCPYYNKYCVCKPTDYFLNPSHSKFEEKKKECEDYSENNDKKKNTLEMNLANNDDFIPINPQITLASDHVHLSSKLPEIIPAINNNTATEDYSTQAVTIKEVNKGEAKCTRVPHTSFLRYSS